MSEFEDGYRLMSRRSHDRNVSGVSYNSPALQKLVVIAQVTLNLSNKSARRRGTRFTLWAHNPAVAGILHFSGFTEATRYMLRHLNHSHGERLIVEQPKDSHMSEYSMVISFSLKGKRWIDTNGWY